MEPINQSDYNFYLPPDPTMNWEFGDPVDNIDTVVFGTPEAGPQFTFDNNTAGPISIQEPWPAIVTPGSEIEPGIYNQISRDGWELHRKEIEMQYPSMKLNDLRDYMEKQHGFRASVQQWKRKISEWRLSKNLRPLIARFIRKRAHRRQVDENKATQFKLRGQLIPIQKVKRHMRRLHNDCPSSLTGSTPTGLSYCTYRSPSPEPMGLNPPSNLLQDSQRKTYQKPTIPVPNQNISKPGQIIPAFWHDHNIDHYLAMARTAIFDEQSGNYLKAKPAFSEALEGLGILLSPVHAKTNLLLENFTTAAMRNNEPDVAIEHLSKSYRAHSNLLGNEDKRTWRSLARLGLAYRDANNIYQAYHILLNARKGLISIMSESKHEEIFLSTVDLSWAVAEILLRQGDYDAAEKEYRELISEAKRLGECYRWHLEKSQWELARMYLIQFRDKDRRYFVSHRQIASLWMDIVRSHDAEKDGGYILALERLVFLYGISGQHSNLMQELLPLVDELMADASRLVTLPGPMFILQRQISNALLNIQRYDEAERRFVCLRSGIDSSPLLGSRSTLALAVRVDHSRIYLEQGKWDTATDILNEVRVIAKEILPWDHEFHTLLDLAMTQGIIPSPLCSVCLRIPKQHQHGRLCDLPTYLEQRGNWIL